TVENGSSVAASHRPAATALMPPRGANNENMLRRVLIRHGHGDIVAVIAGRNRGWNGRYQTIYGVDLVQPVAGILDCIGADGVAPSGAVTGIAEQLVGDRITAIGHGTGAGQADVVGGIVAALDGNVGCCRDVGGGKVVRAEVKIGNAGGMDVTAVLDGDLGDEAVAVGGRRSNAHAAQAGKQRGRKKRALIFHFVIPRLMDANAALFYTNDKKHRQTLKYAHISS